MRTSSLRIALPALLLFASTARAHEFWIEPASFDPEAGTILSSRLWVGIGPEEQEPFQRSEGHLRRFELLGPQEQLPVVGRPGDDPAGRVRLQEEGFHLFAYDSNPSRIELEGEAFEHYLELEGIDHVRAARAEAGQSKQAASESYRRCAKSLVRVGEQAAAGFDRVLGQELELVPQNDPGRLVAEGREGTPAPLELRLLFRGQPAPDVQVLAIDIDDPERRVRMRTDEKGRVRCQLPGPGRWLLSAVHMRRAEAEEEVDWVSLWASLTLRVG